MFKDLQVRMEERYVSLLKKADVLKGNPSQGSQSDNSVGKTTLKALIGKINQKRDDVSDWPVRSGPDRNTLQYKVAGVFLQPPPTARVIRHNPSHLLPKFWGMIMPYQVAEFVNHHIIHHAIGCHHDLPVELQLTLGCAATPSGLKSPNSHTRWFHPNHGREALHLFG